MDNRIKFDDWNEKDFWEESIKLDFLLIYFVFPSIQNKRK